jgi:DNA processing protein
VNSQRVEFLTYLFLLNSIEGLGPTKILNLIHKFETPNNIFECSFNQLIKVEGINKNLAERILSAKPKVSSNFDSYQKELDKINNNNCEVITYFDDDYPKILRNIYYPPIILYLKGSIEDIDSNAIAIVGTRTPTQYGKMAAEKFSRELCAQKITVISGLARGIDSVAHRAALKSGGRTIAVIGSGLDVIYPPENKNIFEEIVGSGAVISEYSLGTKPDAQNFPKRNRIISGLSLGSLIIETKMSGGALLTAKYALDQNREVFALPGNINQKQSEGTNILIQRGEAKLVTKSEDILEELKLKLKPEIGVNIPKPSFNLNIFEEKVLEILNSEGIHIDVISDRSGLNTSDCLVNLLSLEFKGAVRQLPGKVFAKVY